MNAYDESTSRVVRYRPEEMSVRHYLAGGADEEACEVMFPGAVLAAYDWWRIGKLGAHLVAASATASPAA